MAKSHRRSPYLAKPALRFKHHDKSHTEEETIKGSNCDQLFSTGKLTQESNSFRCCVCGVAFSTTMTLRIHQASHEKDQCHQCTICQRAFRHKPALDNHMKAHTKGRCIFQCRFCSNTFTNKIQCLQHEQIEVSKKCQETDDMGKQLHLAELHLDITDELEELQLKCYSCKKTFHKREELSEHELMHALSLDGIC